jgi:hypothetical protein
MANYWTKEREERLQKWYKHYKGSSKKYERISKHFKGKTPDSIYKKLARIGTIKTDWAKKS